MRIALKTGYLTFFFAILGLGFGWVGHSWAQGTPGADAAAGSGAKDVWVATLEIGLLEGSPQAHDISPVSDGPPSGEPTYLEIDGITVGVLVGMLDSEQQVVEVHLFRAAGEPMAQLLIEPDVTGYADHDESTSIEVRLVGLRQGSPRQEADRESAREGDGTPQSSSD